MYEPATWVSYKTKSMLIYKSEAITEAFMTLFRYISGENQEEKKIPMTTPVTNAIFPGHGPNCESNLTMSFYLSPEFQKDPPKPTEKGVYLEARPAMKVKLLDRKRKSSCQFLNMFSLLFPCLGCCYQIWRIPI